jgi:hypothetical protein
MAMHQRILSVVGAGVLLSLASCAPVDPPPAKNDKPAADEKYADAEPLTVPPSTQPVGVKDRIEMALDQVRQRDLLTTNGFWTVFHGILGLGPSVTLLNPDTGQRVNALDYVCKGGEVRGLQFVPTRDGIDVLNGQVFVSQGHQDQFIAEMAQWGVPADRTFLVLGKEYTFLDFLRHAQMRARLNANQELSWTILAVGQYLGTDIAWTNRAGEKLRFEDLLRYELAAPVETAACGGTHRLFGLAWVLHLYRHRGAHAAPLAGVWKEIADKNAKYAKLARKLQNADGSFSTSFFRGPGNAADVQLRMNTTGHTLEWLALALSDAELKEAWVQEAANALAMMFLDTQGQPVEGGTLYHAAHGLLLYYARLYGPEKLGANAPLAPLPDGRVIGRLPKRVPERVHSKARKKAGPG